MEGSTPPPDPNVTENGTPKTEKELYKEKLGDKLTSFTVWTLGLPVVLLVLGGLLHVEAIKVQNLYTLNIGILLSGFGEALTQGNKHHRRMHASLGANAGAMIYLVLAWALSASGSNEVQFFEKWGSAIVATVVTAIATIANIMIGVGRDAEAEVARWTRK
ncbi:hypothetical protein [Couchioplanes caeruleus]|uniref:hypothetical protein n=1 Tax=Couchioplanes caeruleus TaxID=56438 RepID=UPI0011601F26|nr:hypothetical protein [Couchioplanes caeruleus]